MKALKDIIISFGLFCQLTQMAFAETHTSANTENVFLPENAILDTSVPFAIGAREAQQELRGSYGWDTFQEGLVEGVYFRFDPDGYARFSPSARLDSDLFEVICRPRSLNCLARKGELTILLNSQGKLQMSMDGIAAGDQYFISDTLSEFELPDNIWQPLDDRYENVLAIGGELIVRRGQNETARVSLTGFSAVTSYLRWILAGQDYLALPRNWPVPNSTNDRATQNLTTTQNWRAPENVPISPLAAVITDSEQTEKNDEENEDLASLRALVEQLASQNSGEDVAATPISQQQELPATNADEAELNYKDLEEQLFDVLSRLEVIEERLQSLDKIEEPTALPEVAQLESLESDIDEIPEVTQLQTTASPLIDLAQEVDFLSSEYGIEPRIALLLLKLRENDLSDISFDEVTLPIIEEILQETTPNAETVETEVTNNETDPEAIEMNDDAAFVLLTEYFRSVSNN